MEKLINEIRLVGTADEFSWEILGEKVKIDKEGIIFLKNSNIRLNINSKNTIESQYIENINGYLKIKMEFLDKKIKETVSNAPNIDEIKKELKNLLEKINQDINICILKSSSFNFVEGLSIKLD
nr:hypothetical protein [uncultured Fusobacterium sp.]